MRVLLKPFLYVSSAWVAALTAPASAQDTGAKTSGTWENAAIWTSGGVPNSSNSVYIGSVYPVGQAASAATVRLGANESAKNVHLGYGSPTNGVLDLGGNKLTITGGLDIGEFGGTGSLTEAGGSFTSASLSMFGSGNSLIFGTADVTGGIDIENGATLTTAATGNITGGGSVANGATLNLGASMNIGSGGINVEGTGATLNLAGQSLTANTLYLGYFLSSAVNFDRGGTPGTLTLNTLDLGNGQNLALIAGDTISGAGGDVNIYTGATLTTATTANISSKSVNIVDGTLNLGANLSIGNQTVNVENGGTLNLAGHTLSASYLLLGLDGTSTVTLDRGSGTPGTLNLGNLFLGNGQDLTLIAGDRINNGDDGVNVTAGATLTTAATANITSNAVNITTGGTLNLGANMSLSGTLNVQDSGSTFNAQDHSITATQLMFGSNGTAAVTVSNLGTVTATDLSVGNGTSVTLHGGDVIGSKIDLASSSVLTVLESSTGTGLTLNGTSASSLTIDPSSMDLIFTSPAPLTPEDWIFRWKDPRTGDWISTLNTMIADGQIDLTLLPGQTYEILDSNGYTYIYGIGGTAVPEPSSLVLASLGLIGLVAARTRKRRAGVGSRPA